MKRHCIRKFWSRTMKDLHPQDDRLGLIPVSIRSAEIGESKPVMHSVHH